MKQIEIKYTRNQVACVNLRLNKRLNHLMSVNWYLINPIHRNNQQNLKYVMHLSTDTQSDNQSNLPDAKISPKIKD